MAEKWYIANGSQGDIVLSSRVRLARNLVDFPFPCRISPEEAQRLDEVIVKALSDFPGETNLHHASGRWEMPKTRKKQFLLYH